MTLQEKRAANNDESCAPKRGSLLINLAPWKHVGPKNIDFANVAEPINFVSVKSASLSNTLNVVLMNLVSPSKLALTKLENPSK